MLHRSHPPGFCLPFAPHQARINHHNRILLDDPDEQDDADQRDHCEFGLEQQERQECADACAGERREDRDRMM